MKNIYILITICVLFSCKESRVGSEQSHELIVEHEVDTILVSKSIEELTFEVDSVQISDTLHETYPAKAIIEQKINQPILFLPSEIDTTKLIPTFSNSLIGTIEKCFDEHRPLVLTPDVIWLTICQGSSIHINENFDELEFKIFKKGKPKEIIQRNDSLEYGGEYWSDLIDSISLQTSEFTHANIYNFFVQDFSTTTRTERTAYQISLLESYKQSFTYVGETGCGIPSITLKGGKEDWQQIYRNLEMLDEIELGWWKEVLEPVICEFVDVYDGKINLSFWSDIYKNSKRYGNFYLSGWIIKFFPYIVEKEAVDYENSDFDEDFGGYKVGRHYKLNPFINNTDYLMAKLTTRNLPSGLSSIDIVWDNKKTNSKTDVVLYSGFMGMKQYSNKSLEPFIGWAATEKGQKQSKDKKNINVRSNGHKMEHNEDYWVPEVVDYPSVRAIYNPKVFDDNMESISFLKKTLTDSLLYGERFKYKEFENTHIEFTVLINGGITDIHVLSSKNNQKLNGFILNQLNNIPFIWRSALHNISKYHFMELTEEELKLLIKVNSKVVFKL